MARFDNPPPSAFGDQIQKLQEELRKARYATIRLMPDDIEHLLMSYRQVDSREHSRRWEHETIDKLLNKAKPINRAFDRRAYCPLCGKSSSAPSADGFTFPEGLKRHLSGFGNTGQCDVTEAAFALARDRWHKLFDEVDQQERNASQIERARRKTTETLYLTAPDLEPELLDSEFAFLRQSRNQDGMAWAESRLRELGFQISQENNIKSYTMERDDRVVYADPRGIGRIEFSVFKKPLPTPRRSRRPRVRSFPRFHLLDSWKYDIRNKFEKRLAEARF